METTETLQALRAQQERQGRIAAETKARRGIYLQFNECIDLIPNAESLRNIVRDHFMLVMDAPGSTGNHQAWQGGYVDHVTETMNIATQMYFKFEELRGLPFVLSDPLVVLYLHDLEKPWKHFLPLSPDTCLCGHKKADHWRSNAWSDAACIHCHDLPRNCNMFRHVELKTKEDRRAFRDGMIVEYDILLSDSQRNALRYVEGVPDSEYSPKERTMGELAAFCHMADIASARLWPDWGREHSWKR